MPCRRTFLGARGKGIGTGHAPPTIIGHPSARLSNTQVASGGNSNDNANNNSGGCGNDDDDGFNPYHSDNALLMQRIQQLRVGILEEEYKRPPNAHLSPTELVHEVVMGLYSPYDPTPDAGFRLLLQASTQDWRSAIARSIGARDDSDIAVVASALGAALERPNNQYSILVGEAEEFQLDFPSELDFEDGTCWIECQLRDTAESRLLVVTGWDLVREDGAWLVDRVMWQDFRDGFRPGVGREEWFMLVD